VGGLPIYERTDLWSIQIGRDPGERLAVEVARDGGRVSGAAPARPLAATAA
jgi:hypothetical protein